MCNCDSNQNEMRMFYQYRVERAMIKRGSRATLYEKDLKTIDRCFEEKAPVDQCVDELLSEGG